MFRNLRSRKAERQLRNGRATIMQFDLDKSVRYGLAYSGGVDSCYLLAELLRQGYDVKAYTILDDLQITRDTDDLSLIHI